MKVTLMIYLNQSILPLYQTYKNLRDKVQVGLLIQSQNINQRKISLILKILMIMNALRAARQPSHVFWSNIPTSYFFRVTSTCTSYDHVLKLFSKLYIQLQRKVEINIIICHTGPRFNLYLFTISVKLKVFFQCLSEITWPTVNGSVPQFSFVC